MTWVLLPLLLPLLFPLLLHLLLPHAPNKSAPLSILYHPSTSH